MIRKLLVRISESYRQGCVHFGENDLNLKTVQFGQSTDFGPFRCGKKVGFEQTNCPRKVLEPLRFPTELVASMSEKIA